MSLDQGWCMLISLARASASCTRCLASPRASRSASVFALPFLVSSLLLSLSSLTRCAAISSSMRAVSTSRRALSSLHSCSRLRASSTSASYRSLPTCSFPATNASQLALRVKRRALRSATTLLSSTCSACSCIDPSSISTCRAFTSFALLFCSFSIFFSRSSLSFFSISAVCFPCNLTSSAFCSISFLSDSKRFFACATCFLVCFFCTAAFFSFTRCDSSRDIEIFSCSFSISSAVSLCQMSSTSAFSAFSFSACLNLWRVLLS
mmetsp:Transcript_2049/g.3506  ORF Transcript_2049/g.3506 Transcript_2049/m.3506 type:complete len:264 (+) Transcript_2049:353-1144(+)